MATGKLGGAALLLGLLVAACGTAADDPGGARDDAGVIVEAGPVVVDRLQVGDCFDRRPEDEGDALAPDVTAPPEVAAVDAVPCAEPHDSEIYHIGTLAVGDYPGDGQVQQRVFEVCLIEFEGFIGTSYDASVFDILHLSPAADGWADGDRSFACAVFELSDDKQEGSARDIGR